MHLSCLSRTGKRFIHILPCSHFILNAPIRIYLLTFNTLPNTLLSLCCGIDRHALYWTSLNVSVLFTSQMVRNQRRGMRVPGSVIVSSWRHTSAWRDQDDNIIKVTPVTSRWGSGSDSHEGPPLQNVSAWTSGSTDSSAASQSLPPACSHSPPA